MVKPPLLIIQAGTPPTEISHAHGDLPVWFSKALGLPPEMIEVVRVFEGEALPKPDNQRVAIITGSWAMVTDRHLWSENTAEWIRVAMAVDMPLFGVCYGHQLMAYALGGQVEYHPAGREVGCQVVSKTTEASDDALLCHFPATFIAHLTHMQTIIRLPPNARSLAVSEHDAHQIVRYSPYAISTQFHPEFTPDIASSLIRLRSQVLRDEGYDPATMIGELQDAREARRLLKTFVMQAL